MICFDHMGDVAFHECLDYESCAFLLYCMSSHVSLSISGCPVSFLLASWFWMKSYQKWSTRIAWSSRSLRSHYSNPGHGTWTTPSTSATHYVCVYKIDTRFIPEAAWRGVMPSFLVMRLNRKQTRLSMKYNCSHEFTMLIHTGHVFRVVS